MDKWLRSFRAKMIFWFGLSMIVSALTTYLLYKLLQLYYRLNVQAEDPLAWWRRLALSVGDVNVFLACFIPLSIVCFFLFTRRYVEYFHDISQGIRRLASGRFDEKVAIDSGDEFADIAADINMAAEKLQRSEARGDFAESSKHQLMLNLAHDLRTPLTSVLGYLGYIAADEKLTTAELRHYAAVALAKSHRLERRIDELFELARLNYGVALSKRRLDLGELLRQLTEEMLPEFERCRLTARVSVPEPMRLEADGELLARVFENLLTNAVRYGADGQYIDIHAFAGNGQAVVQVINYGGRVIAAEAIPRLFELFYTENSARKADESGTGIGLFICKNIVELHGGTIGAESDPIRTVFEVRLPLADSGEPAAASTGI